MIVMRMRRRLDVCVTGKRVAVGAGGGATTGVVVVKPPKPTASVYTIDVKQKNKMADDVTASPPPAYWEAVEAVLYTLFVLVCEV